MELAENNSSFMEQTEHKRLLHHSEICCTSVFWAEMPLKETKKTPQPRSFHPQTTQILFYFINNEISGLPWQIWRCPEIKKTFGRQWLGSFQHHLQDDGWASAQIRQFWQMLDNHRVFHGKGALIFTPQSLGIQRAAEFCKAEHPAILVF